MVDATTTLRHTVLPQDTTEEDTARRTSWKKMLQYWIGCIRIESRLSGLKLGSRPRWSKQTPGRTMQEGSQKMDRPICASQD